MSSFGLGGVNVGQLRNLFESGGSLSQSSVGLRKVDADLGKEDVGKLKKVSEFDGLSRQSSVASVGQDSSSAFDIKCRDMGDDKICFVLTFSVNCKLSDVFQQISDRCCEHNPDDLRIFSCGEEFSRGDLSSMQKPLIDYDLRLVEREVIFFSFSKKN